MKINQNIKLYLKGILMGICDLIPGISGGTIAFITGIYERFITAIKNITIKNYFELFILIIKWKKNKIIKKINDLDIIFLIILFLGIFSAIFSGAHLISYLLENYPALLFAFFIGLIITSTLSIHKHIKIHTTKNYIFAGLGFLFGLSLFFVTERTIEEPNFFYVFLGGAIAVCALFLPGISGSFILLIMGLYKYIVNQVKNINTSYLNLIPFIVGAIVGMYLISRTVNYLFKKDKCKTLYTLIGLIIGTLIIPINLTYINSINFNLVQYFILINIFLFGILLGFILDKIK